MKNENKSRRETLKLLGRTGLFLGAVPVFFTSLKINASDETGTSVDSPGGPQFRTAMVQEKAFISGSGSSLTVNVTGKPGRVYYVTFAATDIRENYRKIPGSEGTINARGVGSVTINIQAIPTAKVFLKVITGEPENVKTMLAETEPVTLSIRNGVISSFEGTVSRPIVETRISSSSVLIAMAAAGAQDNKILLR